MEWDRVACGPFLFVFPAHECPCYPASYSRCGTMASEQRLGIHTSFQLIEYTMKLVTPVLLARAKFQFRVGLRKEPTSSVATSFARFSGIIGEFKMLGRFFGKAIPRIWRRLAGSVFRSDRFLPDPAMDDIYGKESPAYTRPPHN